MSSPLQTIKSTILKGLGKSDPSNTSNTFSSSTGQASNTTTFNITTSKENPPYSTGSYTTSTNTTDTPKKSSSSIPGNESHPPREIEQGLSTSDDIPIFKTTKSGRKIISGHIEPDYGDMTAEWEPNRLERAERMVERVMGGEGKNTSGSTSSSASSSGGSGKTINPENTKPQTKDTASVENMLRSDKDMTALIGEHFSN
ncbi:hypothetical protein QBC38DRAFT_443145 [Podospora fimiseda]|uniref:Uncharacterized protein n=1 Tax=Podospora fimiseda TaxID=252190 RepID=A0AAN7BRC1_9PEZI|nr:hypothetical protein QBC38DRAFT_443145 [Podospora fimiseda]